MAITRIVSYDPYTKQYCKSITDESEKTYTIVNGQDVAAIIEENKIAKCLPPEEYKDGNGVHWRKVASIPADIMQDLRNKGIWQDIKARKRWLNDSANNAWRRDNSNI